MSSWWWRDCDCGVRLADCFCTDWEEIRTGLILNGLWASEAVQINDNSIEILHFFWKQFFVLLFHSKNSCQDRAYLVNTDDSEFQCCLWMSPLFNANVNCNGQLSSSMTIPARDIDSNGCIYWPWPMSMSVIKFKRFERMVLAFTTIATSLWMQAICHVQIFPSEVDDPEWRLTCQCPTSCEPWILTLLKVTW